MNNENTSESPMSTKCWIISYFDKDSKPAKAKVKAADQKEAVEVFHRTVANTWALSVGDADFKWPDAR